MSRPKRSQQIPNLPEVIKETAWKQIAEYGAPSLSLRAIARELGLTAPSIYRYYPSRDDLVTAMIVDAYHALGETQRAAAASLPADALAERFRRLGLAYREWAIGHPQWYQLIFGTPIPGYQAPEDITVPAAAWSLQPLIENISELSASGKLRLEDLAPLTPRLEGMLADWLAFTGDAEVEVLYLALVVWSRVHGLVSLEIGQQMPSFINDPAEVYLREINHMSRHYLAGENE